MGTALVPVGKRDRKTYIGGGDISGIMGLSPWQTPLDVYMRKIGETPDEWSPEKERLFRRGKRLEPIAIDMLIEEFGVDVVKRSTDEEPNRYNDAEFPWMAAEIDFEWADGDGVIQNGEIKTVHNLVAYKWGEPETDEIPVEYSAQVMWGLMITKRDRTMVGALVGADNLMRYHLYPDAEIIAGMRQQAHDFWHKNVLARRPPDPKDMGDMLRLFAKVRGRPVELDDATAGLVHQLAQARHAKKSAEDAEEVTKFKICDFIRRRWELDDLTAATDDARLMYNGKTIATWNAQNSSRIDVEKLRTEEPAIAAKFTKNNTTRVLRLKKT